jgi:hypothetical protein
MGRRVRAAFPAPLLLAAVIPLRQISTLAVDFGKIDKFESLVTGTLHAVGVYARPALACSAWFGIYTILYDFLIANFTYIS